MTSHRFHSDRLSRVDIFQYPIPRRSSTHRKKRHNICQSIFISWLHPLLRIGLKREITQEDLDPIDYEDQSDVIGDRLEGLWKRHLEQCRSKGITPSLVKVLCKSFSLKFFFFGLFTLAEEGLFRMMQVVAIGYVLDYFGDNPQIDLKGTLLIGVGNVFFISCHFYMLLSTNCKIFFSDRWNFTWFGLLPNILPLFNI